MEGFLSDHTYTCPKCGRRFVGPNPYETSWADILAGHSCEVSAVAESYSLTVEQLYSWLEVFEDGFERHMYA